MRIYFTVGDSADKGYREQITAIHRILKDKHKVISVEQEESSENSVALFQEKYRKLQTADVLVAEVTYACSTLQYELATALEISKQVILLYKGREPPLVEKLLSTQGISENIQLLQYTNNDLEKKLTSALTISRTNLDTRFTILLPACITAYLDKISHTKHIPKSVYIRQLIEREMR